MLQELEFLLKTDNLNQFEIFWTIKKNADMHDIYI